MDSRITTLIVAGERAEALSLLAEVYRVPVGRFCLALVGSDSEAEELVQESFLQALQAMRKYRGDTGVRPWIFGIARRVCIRHLRRRDRRARLFGRFEQAPEALRPVEDPAAEVERAEQQSLVRRALARLQPELREAILLRYHAGLEGPELARALGVRSATARKRVSRGVQELRRALHPLLYALEAGPDQAKVHHVDIPRQDAVSAHPRPRIVGS